MRIIFLAVFIFMYAFGMETPTNSISAESWTSFETLPAQQENLAALSLKDLPERQQIEGNSVSLETLPFRQMTIGGDGDSIRSLDGNNVMVSGDAEEQFFLEHTQEAEQGTLSPDKAYIACYGCSSQGSWVDILFRKEKNESRHIYNHPLPLGQFKDMKWKDSQLIIATPKDIHLLSVYLQELKPTVSANKFSISRTGKEIKGLAIINARCFALLKKSSRYAYLYEIDTNTFKKKSLYRLRESDEETDFFVNSPKEMVSFCPIASPHSLWWCSIDEIKKRLQKPWLKFACEIYAFITVARKPIEVICCAHTDKTFSFWDMDKQSQMKNIPPFDIKDLGKVTKMSMLNQILYISDEKHTIQYPIVQLLRTINPHMSYA